MYSIFVTLGDKYYFSFRDRGHSFSLKINNYLEVRFKVIKVNFPYFIIMLSTVHHVTFCKTVCVNQQNTR